MKKSKKLISLLLALVLLLSVIPMAAAADATFTLGRTKLYDAVLEKGTAPASATLNQNLYAGVANKDIKQSGLYMRLPRYTEIGKYTTTDYLPVQYVLPDDAVTLSNPEVISNLQFSLKAGTVTGWKGAYPCIAFEYAGAKNGSTDVTLKYYYKFDSRSGLTGWYYDIVTFKVNVSNVETTQPAKPTANDIADFCDARYGAVLLECSENWNDHSVFYKNLNNAVDGYSIGEVEENDGKDGSPKTRYPWVCKITVHVDAWIALYNEDWADECGTHYLQEGSDTDKVLTFYWDSIYKMWDYDGSDSPVDLWITHTDPTPAVTEYTVTYTDGVENEEVFADQFYTVKEGDATPAFEGTPTRAGYKFLGWKPAVAATVTGNATYVATWELETYTITYDFRKVVKTSDVKNLNNPTNFTVEDLPITLNTPNFKNNEWPQKFLNWRDADGNVVTEITEPGDITLYAYYQFPVRYRVYDEDGKEVEALTVIDWYDEDDFATYKVRPATVDMPGYELDGWYQTLKDAGNPNKRLGALKQAKKYELVGKLSCCINVTVEHNGEIVKTEKFKGLKGESPDYDSLYADIMSQVAAGTLSLKSLNTYVDGQLSDEDPIFGTNAEVKIVIKTKSK